MIIFFNKTSPFLVFLIPPYFRKSNNIFLTSTDKGVNERSRWNQQGVLERRIPIIPTSTWSYLVIFKFNPNQHLSKLQFDFYFVQWFFLDLNYLIQHPRSLIERTWNNIYANIKVTVTGIMAIKRYTTLTRASEQEPHHQMQFSVIPRAPFLGGGGSYPFWGRYNQHILSPTNSQYFKYFKKEFVKFPKQLRWEIFLKN